MSTPTTVRQFAQALKAEFQENGIYRGMGSPARDEDGALVGPTCILVNRTGDDPMMWDLAHDFEDRVRENIIPSPNIVGWLDGSTDEQVEAVLDRIK